MKQAPLLVAAVFAISLATPAQAEEPQVGDIFDIQPGASFRGWLLRNGGIGTDKATYAVFTRSSEYLIAVTTPLVRGPRGGVEVEKIVQVRRVGGRGDEIEVPGGDCSFAGLSPVLAFFSKATKQARGFFVFRDEIREKRWLPDAVEPCQYSGD